ncbi:Alpha/Beta hydrolase protein [Armillaria novae-zelandiae]|uniref:Alpha/Beta hydrolase protein n=1 Tax=Armillaria novae-zelandiae TaxID=153914 RepID=A0AA39P4F3_9AGAR|nr:Alpha/Beta hydrolase protein [Armillaria novae-zelandiae]
MAFPSIVVNPLTGVELSYIDSGAPAQPSYITIFAIHGMIFSKEIFQKLIDLAPNKGIRFVALDRRPFPGSTPFSVEELGVLRDTATDYAQQEAFIEARGHEVGIFIDAFIQKFNLPPISSGGGVALLGWSLGTALVSATISNVGTLPEDTCKRLERYMRSVILYEPGPITLGLPSPEQYWSFLRGPSVPEDLRVAAFGQWCTSYFDHADLSERNLDKLSWVLASSSRVPSFYNGMPVAIQHHGKDTATDMQFLMGCYKQLLPSYRKAFFDPNVFPTMKRSVLCGDKTCAFALAALWAMQDDEKEQKAEGANAINYKILPGANHFIHWDEPEKALGAFIESA